MRPPPVRSSLIAPAPMPRYAFDMFTIEHEYDATVVTLFCDEGPFHEGELFKGGLFY